MVSRVKTEPHKFFLLRLGMLRGPAREVCAWPMSSGLSTATWNAAPRGLAFALGFALAAVLAVVETILMFLETGIWESGALLGRLGGLSLTDGGRGRDDTRRRRALGDRLPATRLLSGPGASTSIAGLTWSDRVFL